MDAIKKKGPDRSRNLRMYPTLKCFSGGGAGEALFSEKRPPPTSSYLTFFIFLSYIERLR